MDSFAGLDGLSKSQQPKKLADQKVARTQAKSSAWSGLDLLGTQAGRNPSDSILEPARTQIQAPPTSSVRSAKSEQGRTEEYRNIETPKATGSLIDDFDVFISAPAAPAAPAAEPVRQGPDDPLSIFDSAPIPAQENAEAEASFSFYRQEESPQPRSRGTAQPKVAAPSSTPQFRPDTHNDRKIAQMMDMGFEAKDAERALSAMDGNVRGAVSWLMADAQGLELPTPSSQKSKDADFGQVASQIGASVFATASSLFSKGRKEIARAYQEWEGSSGDRAGFGEQPAWMRSQEKYERRARRLEQEQKREGRGKIHSGGDEDNERTVRRKERSADARRVVHDDSLPQRPSGPSSRPSRAQIFRERQAQRHLHTPSPPPAPEHPTGDQPSFNNNKFQSTPKLHKEPEVDLLNLTEDSAPSNITGTQSELAIAAKNAGADAFSRGDYDGAVQEFSAALSAVPSGHPSRIVLLSNRAAARLKSGDMKAALEDATEGVNLLPNKGQGMKVDGKDMRDIWVKLVTRQGQAAEYLERFKVALGAYTLLLDNGHANPTTLEAKRRCQQALDPDIEKKATKPDRPKPKRRGWGATSTGPSTEAGKAALEKVRQEHRAEMREDAEKERYREIVGTRVEKWKAGKEDDLRALIASLHEVLWVNSGWQAVSPTDLVVPKKVRISYMKAIAKTHPDKVPSEAPVEVKLIAQSVFVVIQKAWEKFRAENGL